MIVVGLAENRNSMVRLGHTIRQVQAAMCVIPYVMYAVWLLIDCVYFGGVPASPYMHGRQGYKSVQVQEY